jgi:hypothetical protein
MITDPKDIKLSILVFGPNPSIPHPPGFEADLSAKRQEIRTALTADGHDVKFPEELMHGSFDPAVDNLYIWEQMLVVQYDMIIALVGTPGAICEISLFNRDGLALKVAFFFNEAHKTGLPFHHATSLTEIGAALHTYTYPDELRSCMLMKQVRRKAHAVRVGKFYAS